MSYLICVIVLLLGMSFFLIPIFIKTQNNDHGCAMRRSRAPREPSPQRGEGGGQIHHELILGGPPKPLEKCDRIERTANKECGLGFMDRCSGMVLATSGRGMRPGGRCRARRRPFSEESRAGFERAARSGLHSRLGAGQRRIRTGPTRLGRHRGASAASRLGCVHACQDSDTSCGASALNATRSAGPSGNCRAPCATRPE